MQSIERKQKNSAIRLGTMMVLLSAILAGLRPLFARMIEGQGLNSAAIALYQILFGAVVFGGIGFAQFERVRASIRPIVIAIVGGIGMGIGTIAYFEALTRLPISIVTAIYFTSPAFVILLTSLVQRQLPSLMGLMAVIAVLTGCAMIIGINVETGQGEWIDYLIAFIAPVSWSILLIIIATVLFDFPAWAQIGFISIGAFIPTAILIFLWPPAAFFPQASKAWWGLFGLVVLSGLLSQFLITKGVPQAGSQRASVIGVFEMVTAVLVGWLLFSEPVSLTQSIGIVFILMAIVLSSFDRS